MKRSKSFTFTEMIVVIFVLAIVATVLVPIFSSKAHGYNDTMRCKSYLSNIGIHVAINFADGVETHLFVEKGSFIKEGDLEIDSYFILCPESQNNYQWLTGPVEYTGSATNILAGDSATHKKAPKFYAVFEDGHVSTYEQK